MHHVPRLVLLMCFVQILHSAGTLYSAEWKLPQMIGKDSHRRTVYRAKPLDDHFLNPWSEVYEREFQERARKIIAAQAERSGVAGRPFSKVRSGSTAI